ncbi:hypothetical protein GGI23_002066 [Coemansia sp. RSA 2559]|nr:hypothetical protein GGI23_002066 [Coemansia sp. RSA 2559]KAJ2868839.1 hypothetical protein GGI22_000611 [Coemansia erecta]
MPTSISEFTKKHTALVEKERDYEIEQSQALLSNLQPTHLQRLGYALVGLRITMTRTGLGGKTLLTLEAAVTGNSLPPATFRAGDIVGLEAPGGSKPTRDTKDEKKLSGVVVSASETKIVVALSSDADDLVPNTWHERCTIKKLANDITYKRILFALRDLAAVSGNERRPHLYDVLFGDGVDPLFHSSEAEKGDALVFFDPSLNESQRAAVRLAVAAEDVALIHGPPGTGKTHTIIEVIRQLVKCGKRLLVCGPSNVSVDNLVERLGRLREFPMVRLGHPARLLPAAVAHSLDSQTRNSNQGDMLKDVRKEMDKALARISKCKRYEERRELYALVKNLRKEYREREAKVVEQTIGASQVVLSTLSGAASRDLVKNRGKFDVVIIDEATQAMEGECWIASLQAPKVILAGDHHQLPPTIKSLNDSSDGGTDKNGGCALLETTMFERVRALFGETVCCMLTTQYRMHQDIMKVSSDRLYDGRLAADLAVAAHVLSDLQHVESTDSTDVPLVLVDTAGSGMYEATEDPGEAGEGGARLARSLLDTDSKLNQGEADLVAQHVDDLIAAGVLPEEIAVISPYNAQVRLLKSLIREKHPAVEIGSVDGFQGREKEAVVLSLVRSNPDQEIGFLSDYRRINVAVTRARRHLCVVADSETAAARNPFLKALFAHLEDAADLRYPGQM